MTFLSCQSTLQWLHFRREVDKSKIAYIQIYSGFFVPELIQISSFWTELLSGDAFNALTLFVGHHEEHPACKTWVMRCWCGYLSGARCRLLAWSSWCQCIPKSDYLWWPHLTPDWLYLYWLTQVVLEKRPLNGSSSTQEEKWRFLRHGVQYNRLSAVNYMILLTTLCFSMCKRRQVEFGWEIVITN